MDSSGLIFDIIIVGVIIVAAIGLLNKFCAECGNKIA